MITDAYVKGIRGFDARKAAEYCENSMEKFGNGEQGFVSGNLSETLEYAYFDWCTGKLWESLGDQDKAQAYYRKGQAYRNVWNPEVRWFQARQSKDRWLNWQGKAVGTRLCREQSVSARLVCASRYRGYEGIDGRGFLYSGVGTFLRPYDKGFSVE